MNLLELFNTIAATNTRPLLAHEIIYYCVDQFHQENIYILKSQIDEALCKDVEKKHSFTKNTSSVISALEKAGLLNKHSLINNEVVEYKGAPSPLVIKLNNDVIRAFTGK